MRLGELGELKHGYNEMTTRHSDMLMDIGYQEMDVNEMVAAIKKINEYKMDVNDYLDILSIWYRDVLLFKATNDANHLVFREEIQNIKKVAGRTSYEGIEKVIKALEKAEKRLEANVNFDLTMELLLLDMKENG